MLYQHPTIIILIAAILLVISFKQQKIFNFIALIYPIITGIILTKLSLTETLASFNKISLIANYDSSSKLIGFAFIIVLFVANSYAISRNKKFELIFGTCHAAFAFTSLFAGDFVSLFAGLELMMIFSAAIIFIGVHRSSLRSAKKYFLTHLMSGNMIVIGIAYIIMKTGSTELVLVTDLLNNPRYSSVILMIMLAGFVVNLASFPFSGWMVNYYPESSPSGFLYLISFSTKISVILVLKLFAGSEILQYVAIIMIIYSAARALFENNLLSLLCYLSIMKIGFMVIGISIGNEITLYSTTCYLFIHILYKLLLSVSVASLIDFAKIKDCTALGYVKNPLIFGSLIIGIVVMIGIPFTFTLHNKTIINYFITENNLRYTSLFLSFMTVIVIPWRELIHCDKITLNKLDFYSKLSLSTILIIVTIITFFYSYLPFVSDFFDQNKQFKDIDMHISNKLIFIFIGIIVSYFINITRVHRKALSLIEWLGDAF
ncbi:MAG: hypothetical protein HRU35_04200, partial [Rickettsiaceae bacterium]|nr:hypothetical protein [Rickettsiaceae bacterium]